MRSVNELMLKKIIDTALEEDIGPGDVTTLALVDPSLKGKAKVWAKEQLVLAGTDVFKGVFLRLDPEATIKFHWKEGEQIPGGKEICDIKGKMRAILTGERTALNFLQHLSGIATLTRRYVEKIGGYKVRVIDTRKTTPGLRFLEKHAVRLGGGFNHRQGLYDGALIKDNHIAVFGSISESVKTARENTPHTLKIQVEVNNVKEMEEAVQAGADAVLLDNMGIKDIMEAVSLNKGRVPLEVSGGVDLESIGEIAGTGVDLISVGALTHSARSVDISLEVT